MLKAMESQLHIPYLREVIVFLIIAGFVVPLLQRRFSAVLGYLLIGGLIGPFGLGLFADKFPLVSVVVIDDPEGVRALAEIGVVFLLFAIGLELSLDRLWSLRRLVFGLGSAQVISTSILIAGVAYAWGNSGSAALVLGSCLALSSTAIVTQLLIEKGRLTTPLGRSVFSVLLLQDLAVVPILFVVGVLGTVSVGQSVLGGLVVALSEAALTVVIIYLVGRVILRPIYRTVALTGSREAFMAMILLTALGTAATTGMVGLSMALGAFLAGLLIAETEYRHQVEVDIEPFKGLMLGLFFMSVGMGIDWRVLGDSPVLIAASVIGLIAIKAAINIGLFLLWRIPTNRAVEGGLLLAQAGEFAFIVVGLAMTLALIPDSTGQFMLIVASLSMILTPSIAAIARTLSQRIKGSSWSSQVDTTDHAEHLEDHIVIAGFGRVGQMIASILAREGLACLAIDKDPTVAAEGRSAGLPVRFGDASRLEVLHSAHIKRASALVITLDQQEQTETLTARMREVAPHVPLFVRARDEAQAEVLIRAGATAAVQETVEASLQLAAKVLEGFGLDQNAIRQRLQGGKNARE
ncbi:cation:proton antiporter domain-containing protein [Sphingomicrobium lutaoense]|uniref:CPA2 family monovalent cation:H+ antiporter-2 n=1 Tax=Sphingomicrobium lutaoense TaxID=515949 RepID=A0A839YY20_9SPHN|nr:cation:proton antiporter [Sphingomicrobium lutaoense]MBB3763208.1 CPA2 family monovalent cation:H+ antiporter-2 [Sphingomicrobium lutaoense]